MAWSSAMSLLSKFAQKNIFPGSRKLNNISSPVEVRTIAPELNSVSALVPYKGQPPTVPILEKFYQQESPKLLPTKSNAIPPIAPAVAYEIRSSSKNANENKKIIQDWIPSPLFLQKSYVNWPVLSVNETPLNVIDTEEKFKEMMTELRQLQVMEIAFDVKHSFTTYHRLTCIISISTRFKDYLVDCLSLEKNIVKRLNEIFGSPYILKVTFCERAMDILCLERDFDIYVIGLFDTWKAERILSKQTDEEQWHGELRTFRYLSFKYLNIESSQHGFWKQRPIFQTTVDAARWDSHYLLSVYDKQKERLMKLGNGHLVDAYEFSKIVQIQNLPVRNGNEWMYKYKDNLSKQKWHALTELNAWRRRVAQERNCNQHSVATNKTLAQLAASLPKTEDQIIEIISPRASPMAVVAFKNDADLLVKIFQQCLSID